MEPQLKIEPLYLDHESQLDMTRVTKPSSTHPGIRPHINVCPRFAQDIGEVQSRARRGQDGCLVI